MLEPAPRDEVDTCATRRKWGALIPSVLILNSGEEQEWVKAILQQALNAVMRGG